jgi:protein-L-isoaspartate(D-aspartate) O-methyltransferase
MSKLVNNLIRKGYLKTGIVIDAFSEIHRIEFVPDELEGESEADIPLPIGHGQTISQPATVSIMFELLSPGRGQNILDIGSGSGWTTSLLSYIVGSKGKVTALERIKELLEKGETNTEKFGYVKKGIAKFHLADGNDGYKKNAPYDRILVSAAADFVPKALQEQLKVGGKMVIPVHNDIWFIEKRGENDYYKEEYPGFAFVPLVEETNMYI